MVMMRFAEIVQAFPDIVVMTLFIMYFGNGLLAIIMALVVRDWVGTATLIRAQFYRFKDSEYVLAARTLGTKDAVLIFRHILPNAIGPIVTRTMIAIPSAIFAESFLAYIGLRIRAPEASLGVLLSHAQTVLLQYPYQTVFPAVLISVLMRSFNLFGNGLRDAFDPTQRGTSRRCCISKNNPILQVKDLTVSFNAFAGKVQAVRGVSFDLNKGETLCIVGESGSGKSVTNKAIMGILSKNAVIDRGEILYDGMDLTKLTEEQFCQIRGKRIAMVFQDPLSALTIL